MGIFKNLFGKKGQKDPPSKSRNEPELENQKTKVKAIPLNELADINIDKAVSTIRNKRKDNQRKFKSNYEKAKALIRKGQTQKAQELTSQDVVAYFPVYQKAEKLEKEGNLEEAAKTYWSNIYENGTDAPANFKRLLIVLSKLGRKKEELSVAKIYSSFVKEKELDKLKKRISNIKKKINSE